MTDFDDTLITMFKLCLSLVHFSTFSGFLYMNDFQFSRLHPFIAKSPPSSLTLQFLKFIGIIFNNSIPTSHDTLLLCYKDELLNAFREIMTINTERITDIWFSACIRAQL
jgi:hypothetical protein